MDYYYALLESYCLLKKRKFKLSLREQGERGSPEREKAAQAAMAALGSIQPGAKDQVIHTTSKGKNITASRKEGAAAPEGEEDSETGIGSAPPAEDNTVVTVKGPNFRGTFRGAGENWSQQKGGAKGEWIDFPGGHNSSGGKLVSAFMEGEEDEGWNQDVSDKTDKIGFNPLSPIPPELSKATARLIKFIGNKAGVEAALEAGAEEVQTDAGFTITLTPSEKTGKPIVRVQNDENLYPGYEPLKNRREDRALVDLEKMVETTARECNELLPEDPKKEECFKNIQRALAGATKLFNFVGKLKKGGYPEPGPSPRVLRTIGNMLHMDRHGVRFGSEEGGLYLQRRSGTTDGTDDLYKNMVATYNEAVEKNNEDLCSGLSKEDWATKCKDYVEPIEEPEPVGSALLANRGLAYEANTVQDDWVRTFQEFDCKGKEGEKARESVREAPQVTSPKLGMATEKPDIFGDDPQSECKELILAGYADDASKPKACNCVRERLREEAAKASAIKGSGEQFIQILKEGLSIEEQELLASLQSGQSQDIVTGMVEFFTNPKGPYGLSEERAWALLEGVANSEDPLKGSALFLAMRHGRNEWSKDLQIIDSYVCGGEGTLKGNKGDICREVTEKSGKALIEKLKKEETKIEKELAEAAKCAGKEQSIGLDKVMRPTDIKGISVFETEQKIIDDLESSRVKMGEGNNSVFKKYCEEGTHADRRKAEAKKTGKEEKEATEKEQGEDEYFKAHNERLDNCLNSKSTGKGAKKKNAFKDKFKKSLKGKTIKEAACAVQKKIDEKCKPFNDALDGVGGTAPDGTTLTITPKEAGEQKLEQWATGKNKNGPCNKDTSDPRSDICERYDVAKAGFAKIAAGKRGDMTSEERDALKKIKLDNEQTEMSKILSKKNPLEGEELAYAMFRQSQDGGALNEGLKDAQGVKGEGGQRLGTINTHTYGTAAMLMTGEASVTISGNTMTTKTKEDNQTLTTYSMERGQGVTAINPEIMAEQERGPQDVFKEEEDLFKSFLHGQQKLLEKLINQTT